MQKTFLFASVLLVGFVALSSVRLQLSHAAADSTEDPAVSSASSTVELDQSAVQQDPQSQTPAPQDASSDAAAVSAAEPTPASQESPAPTPTPAPAPVVTTVVPPPAKKTLGTADQYPVRLVIPSVGIDVSIVAVGVNARGEMDVPSGNSSDVGWYKDGPMPGSVGSAVLDAHVFAAFKELRNLQPGEDVLVKTRGGTTLRFRVEDARVYALSDLTSQMLFGSTGRRQLNLITCAGTYDSSIGTYDHRLVDYAVFVDEE